MPKFSINVKSRPDITVPAFSPEQTRQIGEHAIEVMKDRLHAGRDVLDQNAKPLGEKYQKRKLKLGKQPVRDIFLSGNTLGSMAVTEADATHVKVTLKGATPFQKGIFNQNIDPWFGLSETDEHRVFNELIEPIFAANVASFSSGGRV